MHELGRKRYRAGVPVRLRMNLRRHGVAHGRSRWWLNTSIHIHVVPDMMLVRKTEVRWRRRPVAVSVRLRMRRAVAVAVSVHLRVPELLRRRSVAVPELRRHPLWLAHAHGHTHASMRHSVRSKAVLHMVPMMSRIQCMRTRVEIFRAVGSS